MNLKEYEQAKFALASILRAVELLVPPGPETQESPVRALFSLLAEDRFNLAVTGRLNRGKTSLVNAMLGTTLLPVGMVPVASVATSVSYGTSERVLVEYDHGPRSVGIDSRELPEYVTRRGNPDNVRNVRMVHVQIPSELLRLGFHLIDTPGLDAPVAQEDSHAADACLPEADALLVVTSHDDPLSGDELRLLQSEAAAPGGIFLAVNKHDMLSPPEREQNLARVRRLAAEAHAAPLQVFSVSARQALAATERRDPEQWEASGIPALLGSLERFTTEERRVNFLDRMCSRIASLLAETPRAQQELLRIREMRQRLAHVAPSPEEAFAAPVPEQPGKFFSCAVCRHMEQEITNHIYAFQTTVTTNENARARFAVLGGFCDFHTWLYQSMASPRGICLAYPEVLERYAKELRSIADSGEEGAEAVDRLRPQQDTCGVCRVQADAEREAVQALLDAVLRDHDVHPEVCMPHFRALLHLVNDRQLARRLLREQADRLDRLSEDMQGYTIKLDGVRRVLITKEEEHAHLRGLTSLAGHPGVTGPPKRR